MTAIAVELAAIEAELRTSTVSFCRARLRQLLERLRELSEASK